MHQNGENILFKSLANNYEGISETTCISSFQLKNRGIWFQCMMYFVCSIYLVAGKMNSMIEIGIVLIGGQKFDRPEKKVLQKLE